MSLGLKRQSNGRAAVFVTRFERGESICYHMKWRALEIKPSAAARFHVFTKPERGLD
jgi:hypothetical protein